MSTSKVPPTPTRATPKADEFSWTRAEYPRMAAGVYSVVGHGWQGPTKLASFGRWSIRIEFALLGEAASTVSLFLNLGRKDAPCWGIASNYYKWWVEANGGPPDRNEPMTPNIFLQGQVFEVMVEDSTVNSKKEAKSDLEIYSHITKLLSVSIQRPHKKSVTKGDLK